MKIWFSKISIDDTMSSMNFLNDEERTRLKIQHKLERDGRIRDRIKAVLLYDREWSLRQIAEALLISDEAIRSHIEDYQTSKKLRLESGGSQEKLSEKKSQLLETHLQEHTISLSMLKPFFESNILFTE